MIVRALQPRQLTGTGDGPWTLMEADSHLLDVQDMIREAIRGGRIRVLPGAGGRVRIFPIPGADRPRTPHSA